MDQREAVRVPVRVRAQCRAQGIVIDGLVEDVSRNGLFLRSPKNIGLGSAAELDLSLPGEELLRMRVEVVRVEDEPRAGMAMKFLNDVELNRRPLANFIMRQHQAR
jgi:hypothetical protein